jgi:putative transposase
VRDGQPESSLLSGAVLFEQIDEWQTSSRELHVDESRPMLVEAQIDKEEIDPILSITTKAA